MNTTSAYGAVVEGESVTLRTWRALEAQEDGLRVRAREAMAKVVSVVPWYRQPSLTDAGLYAKAVA